MLLRGKRDHRPLRSEAIEEGRPSNGAMVRQVQFTKSRLLSVSLYNRVLIWKGYFYNFWHLKRSPSSFGGACGSLGSP